MKPNDFTQNPNGSGPKRAPTGVKEAMASRNEQKARVDDELNQETIPAGGLMPVRDVPATRAADCSVTATNSKKPFRLGGG